MRYLFHLVLITGILAFTLTSAHAQDAAALAKKLQNPLANIKAIMTDNTVGFNTGTDKGTSYAFQVQPVYAIDLPDKGFTFIPRAVIPIMGLEQGTKTRFTGEDGSPVDSGTGSVWGLGDSILQFFFAPHSENEWKWGVGPQFSVPTHTDDALRGPDWGAGISGVITGNITEQLSFSGLIGNHWSFDGAFNTMSLQPIMFYNLDFLPGAYVGYNNVITVDWKADSDNQWTVPLGLSLGRTFDMGNGNGLDLSIGPYYNAERPDGAADWTIKLGVNWIFP